MWFLAGEAAILFPLYTLFLWRVGFSDWVGIDLSAYWPGLGYRLLSLSAVFLLVASSTAPFGSRISGVLTVVSGALLLTFLKAGFHGLVWLADFGPLCNQFITYALVLAAVVAIRASPLLRRCDRASELLFSPSRGQAF